MIIKFSLEPLHIKRARKLGKCAHGIFGAPNIQWFSKFMTIPEPNGNYWHRRVQYYQHMKQCSKALAKEMDKKDAWREHQQRVERDHRYPNIWDHPVRFFIPFPRQHKTKKEAWRHQFLLYEKGTWYSEDTDVIHQTCCELFGDDNVDRFVRVRSVDGGVQVFVFGPDVPIDIIMASYIFATYSYFERQNGTIL